MKKHCTQNNGDCATCSLVNYGMDCRNNPLPAPVTGGTRHDRMMAAYKGFKGTVTVQAVLNQIPTDLQKRLTAAELGMVMTAVNQAYHNGRASTGAEVLDGEFVWVNCLNRSYDLSVLKDIK